MFLFFLFNLCSQIVVLSWFSSFLYLYHIFVLSNCFDILMYIFIYLPRTETKHSIMSVEVLSYYLLHCWSYLVFGQTFNLQLLISGSVSGQKDDVSANVWYYNRLPTNQALRNLNTWLNKISELYCSIINSNIFHDVHIYVYKTLSIVFFLVNIIVKKQFYFYKVKINIIIKTNIFKTIGYKKKCSWTEIWYLL